jgi:exopolyphosphatase/guanosine-5'-triphosphate,3'-diphosphate pyrophosphatase
MISSPTNFTERSVTSASPVSETSPASRSESWAAPVLAAIDVGSNSLHMVVVRINPRIPSFTIISREKATVRLGGVLQPDGRPHACSYGTGPDGSGAVLPHC